MSTRWTQKDQLRFDKGELIIIDSGYANGKEDFQHYIDFWNKKGCRVCRQRTDTRGLIMFIVVKEVN